MDLTNIYFKIFPERVMHNHTWRLKQFVRQAAFECDQPGKKIIDIGAGTGQYRDCFRRADYVSQDAVNNQQGTIDLVSDASQIPVKDGSFDCALCTQVLEHVSEPKLVFAELYRILKKGGRLYLTTHLAFEEHLAPNDYFRFTRYGLKYLAESVGFRVEKIEPQGGRFIVLGKEIQTLIPRLLKNQLLIDLYYLVFSVPIFVVNLICFLLDPLDKDPSLTLNYEAIFTKE